MKGNVKKEQALKNILPRRRGFGKPVQLLLCEVEETVQGNVLQEQHCRPSLPQNDSWQLRASFLVGEVLAVRHQMVTLEEAGEWSIHVVERASS